MGTSVIEKNTSFVFLLFFIYLFILFIYLPCPFFFYIVTIYSCAEFLIFHILEIFSIQVLEAKEELNAMMMDILKA
eukprot:m.42951 g.42951  ORF g.42951 m.42951 type:complete len:76 (+) comp7083_c0_seq5:1354-1581(+)